MSDSKRKKYQRRILIVDKDYQLKYLIYHDAIETLVLAIGIFLSFVLLFWQFTKGRVQTGCWSDQIQYHLYGILILLVILLIYRSIVRSHQIAGPFIRFQKEFRDMESGDLSGEFYLRKKDRLQSLATDFRKMKSGLCTRIDQDRKTTARAQNSLDQLRTTISEVQLEHSARQKIESLLQDLDRQLNTIGSHFILSQEDRQRSSGSDAS